jgi:RNA polymerase sigma-70 factor, ECF subfamily
MSKKNQNDIQSLALNFVKDRTEKSFEILTNRLRPGLLKYAYKYLKDRDLSQDAVSGALATIWQKIHTYNTAYKFSTWVYRITRNEALGILRDENKHVSYDKYLENHSRLLQTSNRVFIMNTEVIGPCGEELTQRLYDASISAINELDEPYRTVMYEREINQKQLNDIADDLDWNLSTVKTRLRKARKDVAEKLYKKYPDMIDSYFGNENE